MWINVSEILNWMMARLRQPITGVQSINNVYAIDNKVENLLFTPLYSRIEV
jgi:hypothetical protein